MLISGSRKMVGSCGNSLGLGVSGASLRRKVVFGLFLE